MKNPTNLGRIYLEQFCVPTNGGYPPGHCLACCDTEAYFPMSLTRTAKLDPKRNYIFGYHPHGATLVSTNSAVAWWETVGNWGRKFSPSVKPKLGGGISSIFYLHPYLGKIPILTNMFMFQMGWNHQVVKFATVVTGEVWGVLGSKIYVKDLEGDLLTLFFWWWQLKYFLMLHP